MHIQGGYYLWNFPPVAKDMYKVEIPELSTVDLRELKEALGIVRLLNNTK
jgi:hypothetical protein